VTPTPAPTDKRDGTKKTTVKKTEKNSKLKFRMLVNSENTARISMANDIRESLKAVSIELSIESVAYDIYKARIAAGDYDIYIGGTQLPIVQDFSIFQQSEHPLYIRASTKTDSGSLAKAAEDSDSMEEMLKNAVAFGKAFREELPYLPLYHKKGALILSGNLKGSSPVGRYNLFDRVEDWYFEKTQKDSK